MYLVGLTGGIGSGKSTVAARLESLGAAVIDADAVAREVVAPGTAGVERVRARFGDGVVAAYGELDREALARTVFGDEQARSDLNAIVHPLVGERIAQRLAQLAAADPAPTLVVIDVPLLVETRVDRGYRAIVVVVAPEEVRVDRLVRDRGMTPEDARARIAAQASDAERLAVATHVIDNGDGLGALHEQVDAVHAELLAAATSEAPR